PRRALRRWDQGQSGARQLAGAGRPPRVRGPGAAHRRPPLPEAGEARGGSGLQRRRDHEGVDAVSRAVQRLDLHGRRDRGAGGQPDRGRQVLRPGRPDIAFMQHIDLRPDGLYRHQPLTDAAWGRGNAFAAIGLALTLTEFPKKHEGYRELLRSYRQLMEVLAKYQDPDGLWRNVIDHPGAYAEYSATAMIAFSMLRGVREGWLPKRKYQPIIDKAWVS